MSLLAIEHFYEILEDMVIDLRTELNPSLSRQMRGELNLKKMKSAISKMVRLNGFYFQHSRMWTGVDKSYLLSYVLGRDAGAISRSRRYEVGKVLFRDDIKYRIDRIGGFCEDQLSFIRVSYDQFLSYKTVSLNYELQQTTLWFSIAVALLTVLTVIPEDIEKHLISKIWVWLSHFQY